MSSAALILERWKAAAPGRCDPSGCSLLMLKSPERLGLFFLCRARSRCRSPAGPEEPPLPYRPAGLDLLVVPGAAEEPGSVRGAAHRYRRGCV